MDLVKKVQQYIKYWYVRYTLATELYMVDTWEQAIVHLLIFTLFTAFWYFNYSIVMNGLNQLKLQTCGEMGIQAV